MAQLFETAEFEADGTALIAQGPCSISNVILSAAGHYKVYFWVADDDAIARNEMLDEMHQLPDAPRGGYAVADEHECVGVFFTSPGSYPLPVEYQIILPKGSSLSANVVNVNPELVAITYRKIG